MDMGGVNGLLGALLVVDAEDWVLRLDRVRRSKWLAEFRL